MEEFEQVLNNTKVKPIIFTGHYHVEKTISRNGVTAHITPSTFFQIKHDQEEFGVDHHNIGFRVIDLDTSVMMHRVEYLPGNLLSGEPIT
jgi:Icc protein